jgi:hypothetical protein
VAGKPRADLDSVSKVFGGKTAWCKGIAMSMIIKQVAELRIGLRGKLRDYWLSADGMTLIVRENLTPKQWRKLGGIVARAQATASRIEPLPRCFS